MKTKYILLISLLTILMFSCDLFNTEGTGTLVFQGVDELPDLSKCAPRPCETVTDIDGNVYQTIVVGGKVWMAENLKVTHYNDGSEIFEAKDSIEWSEGQSGRFCYYNNDSTKADTFGCLYNWYAISENLAPDGWHVATDDDWKHLEKALGMSQSQVDSTNWRGTDQGYKLKSSYGWLAGGNGSDYIDFNAVPSGYRMPDSEFSNLYIDASFWTSDDLPDNENAFWRDLYYDRDKIRRAFHSKKLGLAVRCVKNTEAEHLGDSMEMTGAQFNIYEMYISKTQINSGNYDDLEWHLISDDLGLIHMEDVDFMAEDIPSGTYKSLKIVFRNQFVRNARLQRDTTKTFAFESSLSEGDFPDTTLLINYFSQGGSFYTNNGYFVSMSEGENMPTFNINADVTTTIYWKGGGEDTKWTDISFEWHDFNMDSVWTPGIDLLNNFEEPDGIPMWTFMVVEE